MKRKFSKKLITSKPRGTASLSSLYLKTGTYRFLVALFTGIFFLVFCAPLNFGEEKYVEAAPDLVNLHLAWHLTDDQVKEIARWDVVVLDMENQVANPDALRKLKELNPDIILLAYITSQEIRDDALGAMRKKLASGIKDEWYLYNTEKSKVSYWPGTHMLNIADNAPIAEGKKFNEYLAQFVAQEILATGLWDGVFYDNTWAGLDWFTNKQADLNIDGVADSDVDVRWRNGYGELFDQTRRLAGEKYFIVGNLGPGHIEYTEKLDGALLESFPQFGWKHGMYVYDYQESQGRRPKIILINLNTNNTGKKDDYRSMRFGLASTLLGDGYFSFDHGDQDHNQTWWYDEYNINLGEPTGKAVSINNKPKFQDDDVWKREYANGITLVNPSNQVKEVQLGGEYEKIIGTQDPKVNDGAIVDRVKINAQDGLIMLKTFQTVKEAVFKNGSFLRFFKQKGERARNGFFVFEEGIPGGARVYIGDINSDGQEEKVITASGKLKVVNNLGEELWSSYPYSSKFKGELNLAVGALGPYQSKSIIISAPNQGSIILYNSSGEKIKEIFPLDKKFKGGFSVAIGNVDTDDESEIIVGVGRGKLGEVLIYNSEINKIEKRFSPYGRYTNGIEVAVGNVQGNETKEIITISTSATPLVRVFSNSGKRLSEFRAKGVLGAKKFFLTTSDVNTDGVEEIVLMND